jgi:hypothetical protein
VPLNPGRWTQPARLSPADEPICKIIWSHFNALHQRQN